MEGGDRLRSRLASLRCVDCGRAYGDGHVRICAARGTVSFVELICRACGGQVTAIATFVPDGSTPVHFELGDLDEAAAGLIGVTDVVEMGRFLATFDGDFRRLFAAGGADGDVIDGSARA